MRQVKVKDRESEAENSAAVLGVPYINLFRFPISPEALGLIPEERARALSAVCFFNNGAQARVGALDPSADAIKELAYELEERNKLKVELALVTQNSLEEAFKLYEKLPKDRVFTRDVVIKESDLVKWEGELKSLGDIEKLVNQDNLTEAVAILLSAALKFDASDIHVEAEEGGVITRYRLDGILNTIATLPRELWVRLISRVKLFSGLKINVTDRPQDGRFTIAVGGQKIDVRVSTIPTVYGESVVMRLLRSPAEKLEFSDLGLRGRALTALRAQIERPNGMIITTGPTGSGKTTTLYAALLKLNKPGVKIITLEDPVEYKLEGINQSQIDASHEYTFAKGLRSILRQDPDVVMVGEIRDLETADTAIQAALTGHLLLSTIHTNGAAGAIPRFLSMGVKPFLLAPALNAILGQRLVRTLCNECKHPAEQIDAALMEKATKLIETIPPQEELKIDMAHLKFFAAKGCDACSGSGYKGRVGIYEVLLMNKEIEQVILSEQISEYTMKEVAFKNGMVTMAQDGVLKALDGITTLDEVFRVVEV
ncbi:MAG: type II secretion system protein E [Candidatus Magasanikbacteria bacterium GW2011_GWA2_45_39]|nr:MAG: type II secretion system protein E [Candidatus Magasanikbacteria bacterium GW2011_GWA2_45_39]